MFCGLADSCSLLPSLTRPTNVTAIQAEIADAANSVAPSRRPVVTIARASGPFRRRLSLFLQCRKSRSLAAVQRKRFRFVSYERICHQRSKSRAKFAKPMREKTKRRRAGVAFWKTVKIFDTCSFGIAQPEHLPYGARYISNDKRRASPQFVQTRRLKAIFPLASSFHVRKAFSLRFDHSANLPTAK